MASPLRRELSLSPELSSIVSYAQSMAAQQHATLCTGHILLAYLDIPNKATPFLQSCAPVLARMARIDALDMREEPGVLEAIQERSARLARAANCDEIGSLHYLAAMVREASCGAYRMLEAAGVHMGRLHTSAMERPASGEHAPLPAALRRSGELPSAEVPMQRPRTGQFASVGDRPRTGQHSALPPAAPISTSHSGEHTPLSASALRTDRSGEMGALPTHLAPHAAEQAGEVRPRQTTGRRSRAGGATSAAGICTADAPSPIAFHPGLGLDRPRTPTGPQRAIMRQATPTEGTPTGGLRRARAVEEPVHPGLRDAWARAHTSSEGLPALRRDSASEAARDALTAESQALRPQQPTGERRSLKERFAARKQEALERHQRVSGPHQALQLPQAPLHPEPPRRTPPPPPPGEPQGMLPQAPAAPQRQILRSAPTPPAPQPAVKPTAKPVEPLAAPEPLPIRPQRSSAAQEHAEQQERDRESRAQAEQQAIKEAQKTAKSLAQRLFARGRQDGVAPADAHTAKADAPATQTDDASSATRPRQRARTTQREGAELTLARRYQLDEDEYPILAKLGRNLTAEAAMLTIDRVVGRDAEINQLLDILGKRRGNNPMLVGDPGVGKTAIVEGLAHCFVDMARQGNRLGQRAIVELELGRVLSGTQLRGSFSERLIAIKEEVRRAEGRIIVFLDEIHTWLGAGASGDGGDAAGELKTALARGQFPCVGATTQDEFKKFVEGDPAFERRFQLVYVEEPDIDTAIAITRGVREHYERYHAVTYGEGAIEAAVRLSHRYIHERRLPDKAISVLDLAGSRAARRNADAVAREDIAHIVAEMAGLPPDRLTQADRSRFLEIERHLGQAIIGHKHVIDAVAEVLRRNYAGFRSKRPIGSLLFLGPTGVGKTELVKALADFLFHDRDAIVRLDMSEFMEAHAVSRMIGAPPGYVGHDHGGQLTEAVRRRPYQVVLLDEIEKAHPDILNLLLQVLDEGRLTDGRGRVVDFSNTLIVMTSNLGSHAFHDATEEQRGRIGFGSGPDLARTEQANQQIIERVLRAAQEHFSLELWNRIEERLVFMPLSREEVARVAQLQLRDTARKLAEETGVKLDLDASLIEHLILRGGWDPRLGARPMRQTIQRLIESQLARHILAGDVKRGDTIRVAAQGDTITFTPA
jgi:ATP-dependent Clp protease ATP-binding subunit ClpC